VKAVILLAALLCLTPTLGRAGERYDPQWAGHPLRVAAYALHPVGVILDYLIFRPAWWIGQFEPIRTLVGREPSREDLLGAPEQQLIPVEPSSGSPPPQP
jgi:hypothetical protein